MENRRLYYVDWLRVLVILSLVPFHAALTYLRYGDVYIKAPVTGAAAIPFMIITTLLSDFFMTLLFFLSGIASFYSIKARDIPHYINERVRKLLLPLLLGTLFLCPIQAYYKGIYEGFQGSLIQFIPRFFSKIVYYMGYAHLWFLLYLFVFSLICVPLFQRWQKDEGRIGRIGDFLLRGSHMLLPFAAVILLEILLRPFFHSAQTLIMDWANDAVYLSVFLFGYVFAADKRIQVRLGSYYALSKIVGILSLALLMFVNFENAVIGSDAIYLTVLWAIGKGFYECSAIVFLICFGQKHLNRGGRAIGLLNRSSFTIYIFHFLPVTFFTYLSLRLGISIYLRYLLVVLLSYLSVFALSGLILLLKKKTILKITGRS